MSLDLEKFRTRLLNRRSELIARLRVIDQDINNRDEPLPADFSEQAVELENREVMEAMDDEAKIEMRHIELALQRIDRGDFGICERCGESIVQARLEVVPDAPHCIRCASELEKRK